MSVIRSIFAIVSGVFGGILFLTYYKQKTPPQPVEPAKKKEDAPVPKPRGPRPGMKLLETDILKDHNLR